MASPEVRTQQTGHASYTALQGKESLCLSRDTLPQAAIGGKSPITLTNPRRIQKFRRFSKMFVKGRAEWKFESSNTAHNHCEAVSRSVQLCLWRLFRAAKI